mmetsp:Transcript_47070/g.114878  ORF Transcript_47070/g.114878 Transcript_47070/m.114878 type:complete len:323 (-) Transcript_47070:190-1158(-)
MPYTTTTTIKHRLQRARDLRQQHVVIVDLNNRGAEALRHGNTQVAMASLSQALYTTNGWLRETHDAAAAPAAAAEIVTPHPSSSSSSQSSPGFNIDELMQSPEDCEMSDDDMDCVDDKPASPYSLLSSSSSSPSSRLHTPLSPSSGEPAAAAAATSFSSADAAYTSPIIIPGTLVNTNRTIQDKEEESEHQLPPPPGSFLSSIIIFNLALAYHMHAVSLGDAAHRATYLKKAKALYQLAIKSQEPQISSSNTVFRMFFMYSVNNLGVVHRLLGDERSANICFQRLLTVLMFLKYCDDGKSYGFSWFFHNLFRSAENSMAPAA